MKKIILLCLMAFNCIIINAYPCRIDGISYSLDDDTKTAAVIGSSDGYYPDYSYTGDVVIPRTIKSGIPEKTYTVTSIDFAAFYNCTKLTSVKLPETIRVIGDLAFKNCVLLNSFSIPDSVTKIGKDAFRGCTGLTDLSIGSGITRIEDYTFYDSNISSLTITNAVTYIGEFAWKYLTRPKTISVNIVDFEKDNILPSLYGLNGTTYHNYYNGKEISGNFTIPESVTRLGKFNFYGCIELRSINIPNSVKEIGSHAFGNCYKLSSVTIPDSVTNIGDYAFFNCVNLKCATIPNSVTNMAKNGFANCNNLTKTIIACKDENDFVTYLNRADIMSFFPRTPLITISIDGKEITEVSIPTTANQIGEGAFFNCGELKSITIPNSVISIGKYAFEGCSGLTTITLPSSITYIGDKNFIDENIKHLYCYAKEVPSIGTYAILLSPSAVLHVPKESVSLYLKEKENNWQSIWFYNIELINDDETGISDVKNEIVRDGFIFNLSGIATTTHNNGIYIKNGKKYVK